MAVIFWIAIFNAAFNLISARFAGPFYCVQEGFFPKAFETEYVRYDTIVRGSKTDYENRRIFGNFTFKKPMQKFGLVTEMLKENNHEWKQYGKNWPIDDMCKSPYKIDHFEDCFSAKMNKEKCSIEAGTYYLNGYNIEEDVKAATETMIYGHWKIIIKIMAEVDGEKREVIVMTYQIWFNDEANKKQPRGNRGGNKGGDKGVNKGSKNPFGFK